MLARIDARLQELPLLLVGVLALHRAGYEIAYGAHADSTLEHTGHGYLTFAWPAVASLLVVAFWRFGARAVHARRTGLAGGPRTSFAWLWGRVATALVLTYVLQELLEAAATGERHLAIPALDDASAVWFIAVASVIAVVIALLLRAGQQVIAWIAGRRPSRARAPRELCAGASPQVHIRQELMGRHLAERGPPAGGALQRTVHARSSRGSLSPTESGMCA